MTEMTDSAQQAKAAPIRATTPPRILGLVGKLERAITLKLRAKDSQKSQRKHEVNTARFELIKAFAIISGDQK